MRLYKNIKSHLWVLASRTLSIMRRARQYIGARVYIYIYIYIYIYMLDRVVTPFNICFINIHTCVYLTTARPIRRPFLILCHVDFLYTCIRRISALPAGNAFCRAGNAFSWESWRGTRARAPPVRRIWAEDLSNDLPIKTAPNVPKTGYILLHGGIVPIRERRVFVFVCVWLKKH